MQRRAAILILALLLAPPALAQRTADIPPPVAVDDAGVQSWIDNRLHAEGWTVIGADDVGVALGSPGGVAVLDNGTLRAAIRHEYYQAKELGGHSIRSYVQDRLIDCQHRRARVIVWTLYERSNLQGASFDFDSTNSEWLVPTDGSLQLRALNRVCDSPTTGTPLPVAAPDARTITSWARDNLDPTGWRVVSSDASGMALRRDEPVALTPEGMPHGIIRQEYYRPTDVAGASVRSTLQVRVFDCAHKRTRTVWTALFEQNNTHQNHGMVENMSAPWRDLTPGSLQAHTLEEICQAAGISVPPVP